MTIADLIAQLAQLPQDSVQYAVIQDELEQECEKVLAVVEAAREVAKRDHEHIIYERSDIKKLQEALAGLGAQWE